MNNSQEHNGQSVTKNEAGKPSTKEGVCAIDDLIRQLTSLLSADSADREYRQSVAELILDMEQKRREQLHDSTSSTARPNNPAQAEEEDVLCDLARLADEIEGALRKLASWILQSRQMDAEEEGRRRVAITMSQLALVERSRKESGANDFKAVKAFYLLHFYGLVDGR